eukprot:4901200-Pleurochrysis_carterae.AAC.1
MRRSTARGAHGGARLGSAATSVAAGAGAAAGSHVRKGRAQAVGAAANDAILPVAAARQLIAPPQLCRGRRRHPRHAATQATGQ